MPLLVSMGGEGGMMIWHVESFVIYDGDDDDDNDDVMACLLSIRKDNSDVCAIINFSK